MWAEATASAEAGRVYSAVSQRYSRLEMETGLVRQTIEWCEEWFTSIAELKRKPYKLKGWRLAHAKDVVRELEAIRKVLSQVRVLDDLLAEEKLQISQLPHFGRSIRIYVTLARLSVDDGRAPTTWLEKLAQKAERRLTELEEALGKVQEADQLEAAAATPEPQKLGLIQRYVTTAERGLDRALKAYREFVSQKEQEGMGSSG